MLFNSFPFLFFFLPVVVAGFYALRWQTPRLLFLVAASYWFYAYAETWFAALMATSTAITFFAGLALDSPRFARRRKSVLIVGIAGALSLLAYFKYAGFFGNYGISFIGGLTGHELLHFRSFLHGIVLPIGISFYTFEGISYLVDVYRRDQAAERNPLRYAFFISFFPHLIAGPIVRYGILRPQLQRFYRFDPADVRAGLMLFGLGLVKKVLIADTIAARVNPLLASPDSLGAIDGWMAIIGFSFQIYFDFSGYSDMALGLARIFGIQLPWNFDRPYQSASPQEFWRRWHVTLSGWLRDYLYIPLGGSRKGAGRRDLNLTITMALGGLWHGASFNFVVWGLYHGVLLMGHRHASRLRINLPRPLAVAVTFVLVTIGWVFFRMHTAADIGSLFAAMSGAHGAGSISGALLLCLVGAAVLVWGTREEWRWNIRDWGTARVAFAGVATALAVISIYGSTPFIYFNF
jgi:alginate O-acetyltransferase complex protein AlgI